mmetsp:Transcript_57285/g.152794  ORF Transcript_57285/g.152794 Transcript_57285/m.152794 type:complete len:202 (-) Transcript_57285:1667-2272(-)
MGQDAQAQLQTTVPQQCEIACTTERKCKANETRCGCRRLQLVSNLTSDQRRPRTTGRSVTPRRRAHAHNMHRESWCSRRIEIIQLLHTLLVSPHDFLGSPEHTATMCGWSVFRKLSQTSCDQRRPCTNCTDESLRNVPERPSSEPPVTSSRLKTMTNSSTKFASHTWPHGRLNRGGCKGSGEEPRVPSLECRPTKSSKSVI